MMKESNSFEAAVKKVLVTEKKVAKKPIVPKKKRKSTYVSEAMAGHSSGGSSMPANITQGGGSSGMPPFAKANGPRTASIDMRDIGKEEDRIAKSHGNKPYPLDTVLDFIANSGDLLQQAQQLVEIALRKNNVSLTSEQKKVLTKATSAISGGLGNINKSAKLLDSINLQ